MSRSKTLFWISAGTVVWAAATGALVFLGGLLFGSGWMRFAASTAAIGAAFVVLFFLLARLTGTDRPDLVRAASLFSVPGMIGEVPILLAFDRTIASMSADQAGLYAAFLFLGYAVLLIAALLAERQDRIPQSDRLTARASSLAYQNVNNHDCQHL